MAIAAEIDRNHRLPVETLPKLAEQSLMGVPYPEESGGAGLDHVNYMIALEEIFKVCATTGIIVETHAWLALSAPNRRAEVTDVDLRRIMRISSALVSRTASGQAGAPGAGAPAAGAPALLGRLNACWIVWLSEQASRV